MERNNLSKDWLSLQGSNDYSSSNYSGPSLYESRNITSFSEDASWSTYSNNSNDNYFSLDTKTLNKSMSFQDTAAHCSCVGCLSSDRYEEKEAIKPKVKNTRVMEATLHQNKPHTITGDHYSHVVLMNDGGTIQMGNSNIITITTPHVPNRKGDKLTTKQQPQQRHRHTAKRQGPILKKITITASKKLLDDRNIEMLCKTLGDHWKSVAVQLGFGSQEIWHIEQIYEEQGLYETIWQFLLRWQDKAENKATFCAMADALIAIRKYDIAAQLKVS